MSETKKCPECGTLLHENTPGEIALCPACLLRRGLENNTEGENGTDQTESLPGARLPGEHKNRWVPLKVDELADKFPELEMKELIGRGGMGAVYKARQKNLDRIVALKILPPEIGRSAAFTERFAREAQAMAKLNHPHIVTIHEFGERAGLFYFLMEFVDGLNLRKLLDSGHVSPKEALAIVPQICDALQYAHEQGIVHQDIKPENILLSKSGQVKIADFGLAKLMGRDAENIATANQKIMGTPQYMAPEQITQPAEVDHRADIYALGVVFYQMLTGELPKGNFQAPSKKVIIDVRLDAVVLKALEKNPEQRYQQVSDIKTMVETIVSTPEQVERIEHDPQKFERVRQSLLAPSIGLRITAAINLFVFLVLPLGLFVFASFISTTSIRSTMIKWLFLLLIILFAVPMNIFIFYAATSMANLHNYNRAVAGSILTMLAFPGNLFGLPMGIWSLVVLSRRDVQDAFRSTVISKTPQSPRFSRVAIFGAIWVVVGFIGLLFMLILLNIFHQIIWPIILLVACVLLVASILGCVAISQIRRSSERLYGMGLALFDALPFPLLALDVFIGWLWIMIIWLITPNPSHIFGPFEGGEYLYFFLIYPSWALFLTVITSLIIDFLFVWWVWRFLNQPTFATASPSVTPPSSNSPASARFGFVWKVLAGVIAAVVLLVIISIGSLLVSIYLPYRNKQSLTIAISPTTINAVTIPIPGTTTTLPSGVSVELFGVCESPSLGKAWWRPDGSPLSAAPYSWLNASVLAENGKVAQGKVAREMVLRLSNLPVDPTSERWEFVPGASFAGGGPTPTDDGNVNPSLRGLAAELPANLDACTVRFGLASGPWKAAVVSDSKGGHSGSASNISFSFSPWTETEKEVRVSVAHNATKVASRVVAIDIHDQIHIGSNNMFGSTGELMQDNMKFPGLRISQIKRLELQTRPFQWVEFRNVSLRPNHKTEPSVKILDAMQAPESDNRALPGNMTTQTIAATSAQLNEKPKLRFVAWQDENEYPIRWKVWHPDGSPVVDWSELQLVRYIKPTPVDVSSTSEAKKNPRFVYLWFSHPALENNSFARITLLNESGQALAVAAGSSSTGPHSSQSGNEKLGWITHTVSPGYLTKMPAKVTVRLEYSIGPWVERRVIPRDYSGSMSLSSRSMLGSLGQNADNHAFITATRSDMEAPDEQLNFIALMNDGRRVERTISQSGGFPSLFTETSEFPVTLNDVRAFLLRTRPIQHIEFKDVVLPTQSSESINQALPGNPQQRLLDRALALTTAMEQGQFDQARSDFDDAMRNAVPTEKLNDIWRQLNQIGGKYLGHGEPTIEHVATLTAVYVPCRWEKNAIDLKVVFDSQGKVSGLWTVAPHARTATTQPTTNTATDQ